MGRFFFNKEYLAAFGIAQVNLALSSFARHARENGRLLYYQSCTSIIPLRDLRYLRENIHARELNQSAKKPQCLPLISLIHADKALITTTTPICLSLRDNAACCIPLRDLRNLRENIHMRVLNQYIQKKFQCLPQISLIYADKPLNYTNSNISFSAK